MKQVKPATRSLSLPKPIAAYFAADRGDGEAVSQCFTDNAVVKDEGHTHKGRPAIREWKTDASAKYEYTCEPIACEQKEGKTVVTSHLVGNFPGSPVDLRFFLRQDRVVGNHSVRDGLQSRVFTGISVYIARI